MGISSALGTISIAKQTVKGTPAAAPTHKFKLRDQPSLMPIKGRGRYAVTDVGRDNGPSFTSGLSVGGEIPVYMEPTAMALLWYLVLGANADSGAGPNYTHVGTPANDLPYCTIWRSVGGVVFEKFVDCKVSRLAVGGSSGSPFNVTLSVSGIKSVLEAADTVLAALEPAGLLFPELEAKAKFDTVAQRIHSFSFAVDNNASPYQADGYLPHEIDVGKREVTMGVGLRFTGLTAFPNYQEFFYGAGALPRDLSAVVGTHAFEVLIERNANLSQKIEVPLLSFAGVPIHANPAGDPIEIDLACEVEKPAGSPIVTVTSKDQTAAV